MKHIIKLVAVVMFVMAIPNVGNAQKIAHLSVDSLTRIWPAYLGLVDSITKMTTDAQGQILAMQKAYDDKLREIDSTKNTASATIKRLQMVQLQQIEDNINAYAEVEGQNIEVYRTVKYDSLMKILNASIARVAKANGYTYVLDSSKGGQVLFANPADDILDKVRIDLKIPVPVVKPKPAPAPGAPGGH